MQIERSSCFSGGEQNPFRANNYLQLNQATRCRRMASLSCAKPSSETCRLAENTLAALQLLAWGHIRKVQMRYLSGPPTERDEFQAPDKLTWMANLLKLAALMKTAEDDRLKRRFPPFTWPTAWLQLIRFVRQHVSYSWSFLQFDFELRKLAAGKPEILLSYSPLMIC